MRLIAVELITRRTKRRTELAKRLKQKLAGFLDPIVVAAYFRYFRVGFHQEDTDIERVISELNRRADDTNVFCRWFVFSTPVRLHRDEEIVVKTNESTYLRTPLDVEIDVESAYNPVNDM